MIGERSWRGEAGEDSYLASVSDLLVGLLFVFIIMLMAFALDFRSAEQEAQTVKRDFESELAKVAAERDRLAAERERLAVERDRLAAQRDDLLAEQGALQELVARFAERQVVRAEMLQIVARMLAARGVRVALEPENGILRLPEELLFPSGQAELTPEGRRALRVLAQVLARVLPCYSVAPAELARNCPEGARPVLESVLVEGHTDDLPIHAGPYRDNWELGAARGVNTFRALVRYEPVLDRFRNGRREALLGVSSYADRRPVSWSHDPDARRLNRRIDIRFLLAAPSREELAAVRDELEAAGGRPGRP